MRIFSSELAHNYQSYSFGYTTYGELGEGDKLDRIYNSGFLPYTGSPGSPNTLYMARSARVVLPQFVMTSENRRIAKKFDGQFTKQRMPISQFTIDETFITFCLNYFSSKHGSQAMSRERFEFILKSPFITNIVIYLADNKPVAYVFEMHENDMGHYWFSFYDITLTQQSLGLWLMLDAIRDAQMAGLTHYYLGTVYGEKALYKTNFEPLEWWDGTAWNNDVKLLRERGRQDGGRVIELIDAWKQSKKLF